MSGENNDRVLHLQQLRELLRQASDLRVGFARFGLVVPDPFERALSAVAGLEWLSTRRPSGPSPAESAFIARRARELATEYERIVEPVLRARIAALSGGAL